jgi:hypothetical protein
MGKRLWPVETYDLFVTLLSEWGDILGVVTLQSIAIYGPFQNFSKKNSNPCEFFFSFVLLVIGCK